MTSPFSDIAPWPPTRHTPPLSADFPSAFDPYAGAFDLLWRAAFGHALEDWQIRLIRAILEIFPEGHPRAGELRWRQAVVTLGRQNGKTEIAAALGLWRLLSKAGALVIGIASSAEQAGLVYRRALQAITGNPSLEKRFAALTDTRGIRARDGGRWELKAARSAALQGLPIDLGLADEVHLLRRALWADLVNGTGGRSDCLVVGITTAGDADSELLIDLYKLGETSIQTGGDSRVGFWVWEAPEARVPEDDDTLGRYLAAANPAIATGRIDLENVIADVRSMPDPDVIRYRLNRFLDSTEGAFLTFDKWAACARSDDTWPTGDLVFAIDRTPEWSWATVTAAVKSPGGIVHTEVVASVPSPSVESLTGLALRLAEHRPRAFAVDGYALKDLAAELKRRGLPVHVGSQADAINASGRLYRLAATGAISHAGDALLADQLPRTKRKNVGENWRISRSASGFEIDAVLSTALGVYVAETLPPRSPLQVF